MLRLFPLRRTAIAVARRQWYGRCYSSVKEPKITEERIVGDNIVPPRDVVSTIKKDGSRKFSQGLFSLEGRTIVVTGAGRGLGITLASAVLAAGGDVVCLDVLPQPSKEEWTSLTEAGQNSGHAQYYQCDITQESDVESILKIAASEAKGRNKPIRGLISCAGIQQMVDAIDYPIKDFQRILVSMVV